MIIKWHTYRTVNQLPKNFWDEKISQNRALTSSTYLSALEKTFENSPCYYLLAKDSEENIVACSLISIAQVDLINNVSKNWQNFIKIIRKILPKFGYIKSAMTATLESYGHHCWFDRDKMSYEQFASEILKQVNILKLNFTVFLFRDVFKEKNSRFFLRGFKERKLLPCAWIDLKNYKNQDDYLASLKSKDRYTIKKECLRAKKHDVVCKKELNYLDILDTCYPLYLDVNKQATELLSTPLPKNFFINIKSAFKDSAYFLTFSIKDAICAFALIFENKDDMCVYVVGLDYKVMKTKISMYFILWECIKRAIEDNKKTVDLGLTNNFLKQRFNPVLQELFMYEKIRWPFYTLTY